MDDGGSECERPGGIGRFALSANILFVYTCPYRDSYVIMVIV